VSAGVVIAVLVAGAAGALLRYGTSLAFARSRRRGIPASHRGFPSAVLLVNVVGSALSGLLLGIAAHSGISSDAFLILVTGLCGGLTTFSTWSVETMQLAFEGRGRLALLNVGLNLVVGGAAAAICYFAALAWA
jgi:CrcB protein